MGEPQRRNYEGRKRTARGGLPRRLDRPIHIYWRWPTKKEMVKDRPLLSKRERAKRKRAFKREHGLTRRQCGAIGAGHMERPI